MNFPKLGEGGLVVFCGSGVGHTIHLKAANPIVFHPKVSYSRNDVLEKRSLNKERPAYATAVLIRVPTEHAALYGRPWA